MMINTLVHSPYIVKQHLTHHTQAGSRRTLTAWMAKHRLPTGLFCFFGAPVLVLLAVFGAAGIAGVLTQAFISG